MPVGDRRKLRARGPSAMSPRCEEREASRRVLRDAGGVGILQRLVARRDHGAVTDDEYDAEKALVLSYATTAQEKRGFKPCRTQIRRVSRRTS